MDELSYYVIRARQHFQLALETLDPNLKAAYEAIALDMSGKAATADRNREIYVIDGVAEGTSIDMSQSTK